MLRNKKFFLIIFFLITIYIIDSIFFERKNNIIKINNEKIKIELAKTKKELSRGLGKRKSICWDCGMLFEFSEKSKHPFWMKDMKFPIDIIWMLDNKIVHIEKNVPIFPLKTINPEVDSNYVLELNSGKSSQLGINIGDNIYLK